MNALTPCLTLAGGVGMNEEARTEWFKAAWMALEGMPVDLLQRGAKVALRTADHPSKIVPVIVKEVGQTWQDRRDLVSRKVATDAANRRQIEANRQARAAVEDHSERESTADILKRVWPGMGKHEHGDRDSPMALDPARPCRTPTRADYLALGVAVEALDAMGIGA